MKINASPIVVAVLIGLGACSERHIVTANADMLVVADNVVTTDDVRTADVFYTFSEPRPLDETSSDRLVAMRYEAEFDCKAGSWGDRVQELTLQNGRLIRNEEPVVAKATPADGSIGASIHTAVCGPGQDTVTRRSRRAIERDYLRRMAKGGARAEG